MGSKVENTNFYLRGHVHDVGISYLNKKANQIADELKDLDGNSQMSQAGLLNLQMKVSEYNNTVSLMTGVFKGLSDTDKEVIRNT